MLIMPYFINYMYGLFCMNVEMNLSSLSVLNRTILQFLIALLKSNNKGWGV